MKKQWIEEYADYLHQMDELHKQRRKLPKASDMVKASSDMHPYTSHRVIISGADMQKAEKIEKDLEKLRKRCEAVEAFIDSIEPVKMRNIIRWRYIDGESWAWIGARIGKGEDAPRKRAERYLTEHCEKEAGKAGIAT